MPPMPAKHTLPPDSLFPLCAQVWLPSPTPFAVGADQEADLVVQALQLNTLSKLTFADSKRFNSLVADIFVGVAFEDVAQPDLEQTLHEECQEAQLVVNPTQVQYVTTTWHCTVAIVAFVPPQCTCIAKHLMFMHESSFASFGMLIMWPPANRIFQNITWLNVKSHNMELVCIV